MDFQWTEYFEHRARSRGFDLRIVEDILRLSEERYFDTATRRMIVVGRHGRRLVMIAYEQNAETVTPVTIHAITRQQINFRMRTGRFIHA